MLKKLLKRFIRFVLSCPFENVCANRQIGFGCVCGRSGKKKEATRQEDITRQERARSDAERRRLEAEQKRIADEERGRLLQAAEPTDFETERLAGLQRDVPDFQDLLRQLATGERQFGGADLGPLFQAFQETLLGNLEQDPFEDTLQEQLSLAEESNRQKFAQRGLLRSGLEREGATRAANELAIRSAQARQQSRQQQLANALVGGQAIESAGRGRRQDFGAVLGDAQRFEDARRARQQGILQNAAIGPAGLQSAGALQGSRQFAQTSAEIFGQEAGTLNQQILGRAEQEQATGELIGQVIGAVVGSFGGQPAAGAEAGSQVGGSVTAPSGQAKRLQTQQQGGQLVPTGSFERSQRRIRGR